MKLENLSKIIKFLENWKYRIEGNYYDYSKHGSININIICHTKSIMIPNSNQWVDYEIQGFIGFPSLNFEGTGYKLFIDNNGYKLIFESQFSDNELIILKQFKSDFEKEWNENK